LILVTGGARSGKSTFAEALAARLAAIEDAVGVAKGAGAVVYLATSETNDEEMAARVAAHQAGRPATWTTIECPLDVAAALRKAARSGERPQVVLLDCVTFWVSNLLFAGGRLGGTVPEGLGDFSKEFIPADVEREAGDRIDDAVAGLLAALHETGATLIAVTNEVGLGVVPDYPIARLYRDELGRVNRRLAAAADQVYLLVAGLPIEITSLAAPWPSAASSQAASSQGPSPPVAPPPVAEPLTGSSAAPSPESSSSREEEKEPES